VNYVYGDADPERVTALTNVSNGARYATFTYDAAGNMTWKCMGATYTPTCTGENFTYVYDGKDQLRRATRKTGNTVTGSEEYWYDKDGQRVAVLEKNGSGTITELVVFLKDTETHYTVSGSVPSVNHILSHVGMGTPVARIKRTSGTATTTELQFHGLASNTLTSVDLGGTVNASFRYGPFGEVLETMDTVGPPAHRRRFNDNQQDELTNQAYYGARYYDKTVFGWTQSDPKYRLAPDGAWTAPRRASLYAFDMQNPLRYLDPDGLSPVSDIVNRVAPQLQFKPANTGPVGDVLEFIGYQAQNLVPGLNVVNAVEYAMSDGPADLDRRAPKLKPTGTGDGNPTKIYVTYTKEHPETGKVYSGRASGPSTKTPQEIVEKRDSGHDMTKEGYGVAELDRASTDRKAIRGREQMLIDAHGGAQSTGGTSGNKINGISSWNPLKEIYMNAAKNAFGTVSPKAKDAIR
jgi:RHS repeat-associated protein